MSGVFEARYGGRCGSCDEAIKPGHPVRYVEDELIHDDCAQAAPIERPGVVCQVCWLVHPEGACDR